MRAESDRKSKVLRLKQKNDLKDCKTSAEFDILPF